MSPGRRAQGASDRLHHPIQVLDHLAVPEPDDLKSARLEHLRPLGVVIGLIKVLSAVEFDDQLGVDAGEIGDVAVNRKLAAELEPVELASSQRPPEACLNLRLLGAQGSRTAGSASYDHLKRPLTFPCCAWAPPSPAGGEGWGLVALDQRTA